FLTPAKQIRVLLVSEPGIMHNTLVSILQTIPDAIIAEVNGALSALDFFEREKVDAVIIDANIPQSERVALITRIRRLFPHVRSIVLTATERNHRALVDAGVDKVLLQNCLRQDIEAAVFANGFE
ncbi:MAG: response regulator, partial [Candidatus Promineifilaceae bacterium]